LEKYEDRKRHIAEELASLLGPGGRHEVVPGVGVTVTRPVYRFDPKLARKVLDDTQYNSICELVPSADLATKMLPGALAEQLRSTNGKPVVRRLS
jgi:hypothetical protein